VTGRTFHVSDAIRQAAQQAWPPFVLVAGLLTAGAVLSAVFVRAPAVRGAKQRRDGEHRYRCPVDGPPLENCPRHGPLSAALATGPPSSAD
jgi:hypothetical protein